MRIRNMLDSAVAGNTAGAVFIHGATVQEAQQEHKKEEGCQTATLIIYRTFWIDRHCQLFFRYCGHSRNRSTICCNSWARPDNRAAASAVICELEAVCCTTPVMRCMFPLISLVVAVCSSAAVAIWLI